MPVTILITLFHGTFLANDVFKGETFDETNFESPRFSRGTGHDVARRHSKGGCADLRDRDGFRLCALRDQVPVDRPDGADVFDAPQLRAP